MPSAAKQLRRVEHLRTQQRLAAREHDHPRAERRQRVGDARRSRRASDRPRRCCFHQSHDTQRLLQRLVGKKITQRQHERPVRHLAEPDERRGGEREMRGHALTSATD